MSDDIVVVDNGSTYETKESAIVAKNEADRAEQWAKYSEAKANLADERAVNAAKSSDAAAQAATTAIQAKQYAETAVTDKNLIVVATDLKSTPSNIKRTAESIGNVNTVGNNIKNINAVAANKANIDKVATNKTNIDTVATNIVNVNTVAKNIDNVNLLAPHTGAMEALAPDIMDVVTVAGIAKQTKNVSDNMSAVVDTSNNKTNINNVSVNMPAVKDVSKNMADVKKAVQSANDAKLWAVGTIAEKPEGSSKYWAEQAQQTAQVYDASETVKGIVRLATSKEAKAGLDDKTAITPLKLKQNIVDNVGRVNQLGFNGTLAGGVITFRPDQGTYELKAGYEYEIDLLFSAVGTIPDTTQLKIVNGTDTINIVNVLDSDYSKPTTYKAMKQVCRYDTKIGWRWIFNVRYSVASDGSKVFVMPATSIDVSDKVEKSSIKQDLSTPSADTVPSTKAVSNESSRIVSIMNNKVSKSGDKMTGILETTGIFRTLGRINRIVEIKSADGQTVWGSLEFNKISDTEGVTYLFAFNPTDDNKNAQIGIHIKDNEKWADCPMSQKNNSIVTTATHNTNYMRFGNGLQICWGSIKLGEQLITFPQAFKNTSYIITSTSINDKSNANASTIRIDTKTTTGVKAYCGLDQYWIAIGYWY